MNRVNFFGTYISDITVREQLDTIEKLLKINKPSYITYSNVHVVVTAKKDKALQKAVNSAVIASPDSMPLVKAARRKGYTHMERCTGPDMMDRILELSCKKGYTNYFYGTTDETLGKLKESLYKKYPGIKIAGMHAPPFRPLTAEENKAVFLKINEMNPDFIWIGLGAPKQEIWMHQNVQLLNRGIMFGVGAAFDFLAGTKKRAPEWMQKMSLEWFYRLISEPRRLWKRYLVTNTLFMYYHWTGKG